MSKSNWLPDDKQTGNFSNNQQDTFDPKKRYVGIRLQQGVPLLDRDWNELEDIRRNAEVMLGKYYIGNGAPDDGFKVSLIDAAGLNFGISSGRCLVDGFDVVNEPYDQNGDKLDFILYSQQEDVPAITSFSESRTDTVYLDVWVEEVSAVQDSALKNSRDIDMETCRRHKLEWRVRVDEGSKGYEKVLFHHYYDLAKINWSPAANVEDLRVTGLKVLQLREEVELLKDHAGKHTHSKLVGEGGAPDPALQVDQNGNVGIGTVEPGKKLDVNGDIRADNFYKLLPHNIISNSFMNRLNGTVPIGFTIGKWGARTSTMQIEAVHPFTKGFEGPSSPLKPANAVDNVDDATGSNPYWFGRYWKGPRAARGGLADGWMGRTDGHILKITGKRDTASSNIFVMFPKERRILTARLLFRAWVKITKGAFDFGTDMSVNPQITRAMTETAPQGWYFINRIIDSSHVTDIGEHAFIFKCFGEDTAHVGDFEIYLALPYLANIEIDDSPHWSPSILDILSDYGATIDLDTGNVGIGTTSPASKLHINSDGTTSLRLTGAGTGHTHAEIVLEATSSNNFRGLGIFMHDAGGDTEWYAGTPYVDADQYQIGRASGVTSHSGATAQVSNAFLTIKNSGNVGIGTTTPLSNVGNGSLKHSLETTGWILARGNGENSWGDPASRIGVMKPGGSDCDGWWISANTDNTFAIHQGCVGDRLRIDSNGNVGIGTNNPGSRLHVKGSIHVESPDKEIYCLSLGRTDEGNRNHSWNFWHMNSNYGKNSLQLWEYKTDSKGVSCTGNRNDGAMCDPRVTFAEGGNVGIGTTNPGAKLEVVADSSKPTWGGWYEAIRLGQSGDSAITYPTGGLLFGLHSDRRFYFADTWKSNYIMIIDANPDGGNVWAKYRSGGGIDYAEYFESKDGKEIKPGTPVVIDGDKIRPAKKGETPFGIISANPLISGGVPIEWPKKYIRDEFGRVIMEEYQEEIMAPKKEKIKKERQKVEKKKVKEEVTRTEVVKIKGKYCQKEITETIEREIQEPVFKEEDLYDAKGKQVIGKHRVPVMETYQEEIDVLDEKGQPVMMGTGKFETKTRAKINPEHDETKEYIPREKRPEWNCVGLLGQLPLLKGQPTAPTWVKIKDLTKDVELWLVK